MVVLTMTDCPPKLRGDLSKWLCEINTGVYVGKVSARVRDQLWERVRENIAQGKATMVYTAANEQGMEFRTHNTTWQPVDFDGIRLMRRPLPEERSASDGEGAHLSHGSKAGKLQKVRRIRASQRRQEQGFVVVDLETTGLSPQKDEIIEVGALRVVDGKTDERFSALLLPEKPLPEEVSRLTGITQEELEQKGEAPDTVLKAFLEFVQGCPLVFHNAAFDCAFLERACQKNGLAFPNGKCTDTLQMAKRLLEDVENYKLETVAEYFGYAEKQKHRALSDCEMTLFVYNKLKESDDMGF